MYFNPGFEQAEHFMTNAPSSGSLELLQVMFWKLRIKKIYHPMIVLSLSE